MVSICRITLNVAAFIARLSRPTNSICYCGKVKKSLPLSRCPAQDTIVWEERPHLTSHKMKHEDH